MVIAMPLLQRVELWGMSTGRINRDSLQNKLQKFTKHGPRFLVLKKKKKKKIHIMGCAKNNIYINMQRAVQSWSNTNDS